MHTDKRTGSLFLIFFFIFRQYSRYFTYLSVPRVLEAVLMRQAAQRLEIAVNWTPTVGERFFFNMAGGPALNSPANPLNVGGGGGGGCISRVPASL